MGNGALFNMQKYRKCIDHDDITLTLAYWRWHCVLPTRAVHVLPVLFIHKPRAAAAGIHVYVYILVTLFIHALHHSH